MNLTIKRTATVLAAGAVAVAATGIAYAYWTTTGAGSGSATTGTTAAGDAIQLTQVGTLTGFYPGSAAQDVMVKATNPALFSQKVGNITVTVATVGGCASSNWDVVDVAETNPTLAAGANSGASGVKVATIQLLDTASNQDACKSISPTLTFASASGA